MDGHEALEAIRILEEEEGVLLWVTASRLS